MVTAERELAPKVDGLEPKFTELYSYYLGARGLMFSGDTVVRDPANYMSFDPPADVDAEQRVWVEMRENLDMLVTRFEQFYPLDPLDLSLIAMRFGRPPTMSGAASGGEPGEVSTGLTGEVAVDTSPTTVAGRVAYASTTWMHSVDAMVDAGPESRDGSGGRTESPAGEWTGPAAAAFQRDFLEPYRTAHVQQVNYAHQMYVAASIYRNAVREGIGAVNRVLDACDTALSGGGGTGTAEPLELVAVLSGILGYVPGPVGMGADVVGLTLDLQALVTGPEYRTGPPPIVVEGANPAMFLESAWSAVRTVEDDLAQVDDILDAALNTALDDPGGFGSDKLRIERPELAGSGDPAADFGRLTIPSGGVPLHQSQVVATLVDIYTAGYVNLPGAAAEYAGAAEIVDQCRLPGYLTWFFQRSPARYEEARTRLAQIFSSMSRDLTDSGTALVETALSYEATDAENAEVVTRIDEIAPPPVRGEPPPVTGQPVAGY